MLKTKYFGHGIVYFEGLLLLELPFAKGLVQAF